MSKWLVELGGTPRDLQFIAHYINSSELNIIKEKDIFYLESKELYTDKPITDIMVLVDDLIDILNGAAILYYPKIQRITHKQIFRIKENGERESFALLHAQPTDTLLYSFRDDDKTLPNWLEIGKKDEAVARAFTLYGALEHNWRNLYMVLDVIQDDLGGEKNLIKQKWLDKNRIKLFKSTANSYRAIGKAARHAKKSFEPPKKPMDIHDAQTLFDLLLREWLKYKSERDKA